MAKNAGLKALKTVNYQEAKEFEQKNDDFNLANILIKDIDVSLARQKTWHWLLQMIHVYSYRVLNMRIV